MYTQIYTNRNYIYSLVCSFCHGHSKGKAEIPRYPASTARVQVLDFRRIVSCLVVASTVTGFLMVMILYGGKVGIIRPENHFEIISLNDIKRASDA